MWEDNWISNRRSVSSTLSNWGGGGGGSVIDICWWDSIIIICNKRSSSVRAVHILDIFVDSTAMR